MITLQNIVKPERSICTEHDLYYRAEGAAGFSESAQAFRVGVGGKLSFDTYFNLFNLGKWRDACALPNLFVEIEGQGHVELRVMQALPGRSWEVLFCDTLCMESDHTNRIELPDIDRLAARSLLFLQIKGLEDTELQTARFVSDVQVAELPKLAVTITTYRREAEVQETVRRLQAFRDGFEHGERVHIQVIDNGQSAKLSDGPGVTALDNPNYGGAGGFARGLLEAEKGGFSHCLFMDDDASFHMENIARTFAFLALVKDRSTAVAGAMINTTHKWAMWENGAYFDGSCHPMFCGTDLRSSKDVMEMEFASGRWRPKTIYGGWWFFAFAVDRVKHHPFPFFVRGDDISFSLMNNFQIHTLNGVVSFHADFSERESAQTLYLDLRNHLIHHFVSDDLERSAFGTARVALWFIGRSLLRFHYESATAQILSWQDVMRGPAFFDENIDMAERRATISTMINQERWRDIDTDDLSQRKQLTEEPPLKRRRWALPTVNGHLVPFSRRRWDRIVLEVGDRGLVHPAYGASQITYLNMERNQGYTVEQDKLRFFRLSGRVATTLVRFLWNYRRLKRAYRDGYDSYTTREYWERKLA